MDKQVVVLLIPVVVAILIKDTWWASANDCKTANGRSIVMFLYGRSALQSWRANGNNWPAIKKLDRNWIQLYWLDKTLLSYRPFYLAVILVMIPLKVFVGLHLSTNTAYLASCIKWLIQTSESLPLLIYIDIYTYIYLLASFNLLNQLWLVLIYSWPSNREFSSRTRRKDSGDLESLVSKLSKLE